jgi:hypothetical protein
MILTPIGSSIIVFLKQNDRESYRLMTNSNQPQLMKTSPLLLTLVVALLLLGTAFAQQAELTLNLPDSDPYRLDKIIANCRASRLPYGIQVNYYLGHNPDLDSIISIMESDNGTNKYLLPFRNTLKELNINETAELALKHTTLLTINISDANPPTEEKGWSQINECWTWKSSQPEVLYSLGWLGNFSGHPISRFYEKLDSNSFTPDVQSWNRYCLIAQASNITSTYANKPNVISSGGDHYVQVTEGASGLNAVIAYRFETEICFIAGKPGTTTLTLSHFSNAPFGPRDTDTPDRVLTFQVTVPADSLQVEEKHDAFLSVGSDGQILH